MTRSFPPRYNFTSLYTTSSPLIGRQSHDEARCPFIGSQPFATARDALIELVRAAWDVEAALNNWSPDQAEEGDRDDEGQPPSKQQHLNDDDDNGEVGDSERGKGKGKRTAD